MLKISQLTSIISESHWLVFIQDRTAEHLLTDSRKISFPNTSVFFAIKGENHNGHDFIAEAYRKGIRIFVVAQEIAVSQFPEANILFVPDSILALQEMATFHRHTFQLPVVGITGSNGKTIVKEWTDSLLGRFFNLVKSPKSYNSQLGVPLSVWQIHKNHTLGVFEAGLSKAGEMEKLAKIIEPTIGIFTNIGTAHDEGFKNRRQKIQEKLRLFRNCPVLIYCLDHPMIHDEIQRLDSPPPRLITWSKKNLLADVHFFSIKNKKNKHITRLGISDKNNNRLYSLEVPFIDKPSLENLMHCLALAVFLGIDLNELQPRLRLLKNPSMRLTLKQGTNGCYLVDDAYNNDLAGLSIALDFLSLQQKRERKTVILSDVLQSGMKESDLYEYIAQLLENHHIDKLIGIGEEISRNRHHFPKTDEFYKSTDAFLGQHPTRFANELILVKGARKFTFEKITARLEQKIHGTVLEISLDAISKNLRHYRSQLKPETKLMVMVKAFAYGSGSVEVANLLQYHRIDYLAVAYADEGVLLRENGVNLPIMVLNPSPDSFEKLLQYDLEPNIYSREMLEEVLDFLKLNHKRLAIHLAFDTGMHRLGFGEEDMVFLQEKLRKHSVFVEIATIYTHLAAADEPEKHQDFTLAQLVLFQEWTKKLMSRLPQKEKPLCHALNTPGIINYPDFQLDMVRLGAGLYGIGLNEAEKQALVTVSTLKTTISQIKHLKAGETVGYGRHGKIEKDATIATIAVGYADGFSRDLGNGVGKVLINNLLCPVIGNVCMDMTMIDISETTAKAGDEVIIFGENPSIYEQAVWRKTIPYEVLASIGERVKRVFFTE
jgi:Alr-MurF fusion protein